MNNPCGRCKVEDYEEDGWCNYYDYWCKDNPDVDEPIIIDLSSSRIKKGGAEK
jgi:hypothetical protein